ERVALAEQAVGEGDAPDVAVLALPAGDPLGAGDPHVLALGGLEHDPAVLAAAAVRGPHPLPVDAAVDDDGGAGGRELGGPLDGAQRVVGGPARGVGTGGGDVDDRHGSGVPLGRRWCGDEVGGVLDRRAPRGRRARCCAGGSTTARAPRAGVVRALLWEGCRHLGHPRSGGDDNVIGRGPGTWRCDAGGPVAGQGGTTDVVTAGSLAGMMATWPPSRSSTSRCSRRCRGCAPGVAARPGGYGPSATRWSRWPTTASPAWTP